MSGRPSRRRPALASFLAVAAVAALIGGACTVFFIRLPGQARVSGTASSFASAAAAARLDARVAGLEEAVRALGEEVAALRRQSTAERLLPAARPPPAAPPAPPSPPAAAATGWSADGEVAGGLVGRARELAGGAFVVRSGVDIKGFDVAAGRDTAPGATAEECAAACASGHRGGCNAFTLVFGTCYLKAVPERRPEGRQAPAVVARGAESGSAHAWAVNELASAPSLGSPVLVERFKGEYSSTNSHVNLRFARPGRMVGQRERVRTIAALLDAVAHSFLEPLGIEYWLSAGTLLGQHRDGSVIPWDEDADVGVTEAGLAALREAARARPDALPAGSALVLRTGEHSDVIPFQVVNTTNGVYVDSRLYLEDGSPGRLVHRSPYGHQRFARAAVFPLRRCRFEGAEYFCPAEATTYLRSIYASLAVPLGRAGYKMPD